MFHDVFLGIMSGALIWGERFMNDHSREILASRIATLGGVGQLGMAPGTLGSLVTLPLCYLAMSLGITWHLLFLGIICAIGTWAAHQTAIHLGDKDPKEVVVDEMAGMMLTMVHAPKGWTWLLTGFLAFRLFDIWKPWPVNWIDRNVPGGLGIMADDLAAGIYAWLLLTISTLWMVQE